MLSISELCLFSFNWNHLLYTLCLCYKLWAGKCGKTKNLFHCVAFTMEIDCARYSVVVLLDWLVFCVLCWGSCLVYNTFHVLLPITKQTFATWVYYIYIYPILVARESVLKMYFIQFTDPLNAIVCLMGNVFGEIPNKLKCLYRWINILKAIILQCLCFFGFVCLVQYVIRKIRNKI